MKQEDVKEGMRVVIRGTVVIPDDGMGILNVIVRKDSGQSQWFTPEDLEPETPKYDPARKYRKGDRVRIVGYHGRLFGIGGCKLSGGVTPGVECELEEGENDYGQVVLPPGYLDDDKQVLSVACIKLTKSIEEIETEKPYYVSVGAVRRKRDDSNVDALVATVWYDEVEKEEADKIAQEICDRLNREHAEKSTR